MDPEDLRASGWLAQVGGAIVAADEPSCMASDEGTRIDFFVVAERLLPFIEAVTVRHGSPLHTHRPVVLKLRGRPRRESALQLAKPKRFPVERPFCPRAEEPQVPDIDGLTLENGFQQWCKSAERSLC